ncbi:MAG: hypothetical protein ACLFRB_10200 [Thiohalorhabdus sp.]|uniref:hypothetical protein n=1 Tax=Thiohalorhabdus sp. TaxID=3094134 RepID=UPI00397F4E87
MPRPPTAATTTLACLALATCAARAEPPPEAEELPVFDVVEIGGDGANYRAAALNDRGTVVGQRGTVWTAPWRWRPGDEAVTVLPFLPKWEGGEGREAGNPVAVVRDINNEGVAVGSGGGDYEPERDPVLWDAEGAVQDLGGLPDATREAGAAERVTDDGTVYGWTLDAEDREVGFRWTEDTGMESYDGEPPEEEPGEVERRIRQFLADHELGALVAPEEVPEFPVEEEFQPGPDYFDDLRIQDINRAGQIVGWRKGLLGTQRSYLLTPRTGDPPR